MDAAPIARMFQYPQRIDGGFKIRGDTVPPRHIASFSILSGSMVGSSSRSRSGRLAGGRVSVSSADRWWVQAFKYGEIGKPTIKFQYPQRIDGGFKARMSRALLFGAAVSVSSADRWWVQADRRRHRKQEEEGFSILSGSMVGSSSGRREGVRDAGDVSVSSADRWWVQDALRNLPQTATDTFQYPQRIDGGFKIRLSVSHPLTIVFQYPQRIDGGFKFARAPKWRPSPSFSILSGSMVGSRASSIARLGVGTTFQYPQRIDGGFKFEPYFSAEMASPSFSILSGSMVGSS